MYRKRTLSWNKKYTICKFFNFKEWHVKYDSVIDANINHKPKHGDSTESYLFQVCLPVNKITWLTTRYSGGSRECGCRSHSAPTELSYDLTSIDFVFKGRDKKNIIKHIFQTLVLSKLVYWSYHFKSKVYLLNVNNACTHVVMCR